MTSPCDKCKKKREGCQARCFPLKDYKRALKKRRIKTHET